MKAMKFVLAVVALTAFSAEAKTAVDLPVSGVTNRMYLTSMKDRPWWDTAWTRRAPKAPKVINSVR